MSSNIHILKIALGSISKITPQMEQNLAEYGIDLEIKISDEEYAALNDKEKEFVDRHRRTSPYKFAQNIPSKTFAIKPKTPLAPVDKILQKTPAKTFVPRKIGKPSSKKKGSR